MGTLDPTASKTEPKPYLSLRDDPRYPEIKKIIEEFPPEKMEKLKRYIRQWLGSC